MMNEQAKRGAVAFFEFAPTEQAILSVTHGDMTVHHYLSNPELEYSGSVHITTDDIICLLLRVPTGSSCRLVHNHLDGDDMPSREDVEEGEILAKAVAPLCKARKIDWGEAIVADYSCREFLVLD